MLKDTSIIPGFPTFSRTEDYFPTYISALSRLIKIEGAHRLACKLYSQNAESPPLFYESTEQLFSDL